MEEGYININRWMFVVGFVASKVEVIAGNSKVTGRPFRLAKVTLRDPETKAYTQVVGMGKRAQWIEKFLTDRPNQLVMMIGTWRHNQFTRRDGSTNKTFDFFPLSMSLVGKRVEERGPKTNFKADTPEEVITYGYAPPDFSADADNHLPWYSEEDAEVVENNAFNEGNDDTDIGKTPDA